MGFSLIYAVTLFSQMQHNIKCHYITASQLKEITNVGFYCAEYYLFSDTKVTQFLK